MTHIISSDYFHANVCRFDLYVPGTYRDTQTTFIIEREREKGNSYRKEKNMTKWKEWRLSFWALLLFEKRTDWSRAEANASRYSLFEGSTERKSQSPRPTAAQAGPQNSPSLIKHTFSSGFCAEVQKSTLALCFVIASRAVGWREDNLSIELRHV